MKPNPHLRLCRNLIASIDGSWVRCYGLGEGEVIYSQSHAKPYPKVVFPDRIILSADHEGDPVMLEIDEQVDLALLISRIDRDDSWAAPVEMEAPEKGGALNSPGLTFGETQAGPDQPAESRGAAGESPLLAASPPAVEPPLIAAEPPPLSDEVPASEPLLSAESGQLYLTRAVTAEPTIKLYQSKIDAWSDKIPFSPIKQLSRETQFVSATERAAYRTTVTSQIEKRWTENHEVPYRGETLPADGTAQSTVDPRQIHFPQFADFAEHKQSHAVAATRRMYSCHRCAATGQVTCDDCAGRGRNRCGSCSGSGQCSCGKCSGSGRINEYRKATRMVKCRACGGSGQRYTPRLESCDRCNGKGWQLEEYTETVHAPCPACASSGRVTCSRCNGSGEVTCSTCNGVGRVTCPTCEGQRRLMSFISAERKEEPKVTTDQYSPPALPAFKKGAHPLSHLRGEAVIVLDQPNVIERPDLGVGEASPVLDAQVAQCRRGHGGKILRQRIVAEQCPIVEYRYRYKQREYGLFLNPRHNLIEDLDGPIQAAVSSIDQAAEAAFREHRLEDSYRLNLRSLCMDEASNEEKSLRSRIQRRLLRFYLAGVGCVFLLAAVAQIELVAFPQGLGGMAFPFGLGLALAAGYLFARDGALRLSGPHFRWLSSGLIGLACFLAVQPLSLVDHWGDSEDPALLVPSTLLVLALGGFAQFRRKARSRRNGIERHLSSFPDRQSLESFVTGVDPSDRRSAGTLGLLVGVCALFFWVPTLRLIPPPPPGHGSIQVQAEDRYFDLSGASVSIDGQKVEASYPSAGHELLVAGVLEGQHRIMIEPRGARPRSCSINVEPNATTHETIAFITPPSDQRRVEINFQSSLSHGLQGAMLSVLVDGKSATVYPNKTTNDCVSVLLAPGAHELEVRAPGFRTWKGRVLDEPMQRLWVVTPDLKLIYDPATMGSVRLPGFGGRNAQVYVDGERVEIESGPKDVVVPHLPQGPHRLVVLYPEQTKSLPALTFTMSAAVSPAPVQPEWRYSVNVVAGSEVVASP